MKEDTKKTFQTIEEYEIENKDLLKVVREAAEKFKQVNLYPDLWSAHKKGLDDDVESKIKSLQIPRPLNLLSALEYQIGKEAKKLHTEPN